VTRFVPATLGPRANLALPHGASLAYRESLGAAGNPPLVLLHGLAMTADLNWSPAYAELCQRFRVIAPDLPGHGRDIRPWPTFSLEKCADHMLALADSLGIDKFIACGYSMGSLVAQLIWRRHPDRVSALVLAATSRNFLGTPTERLISSLSTAFAVAARANPLLRSLHADAFGTGYLTNIDDESRRYVRAEMSLTSMSTVAAALVAVADFTSHTWIADIDIPVSVLVTTRDSVVPHGRQMKLAQAIPHATVVTIEGDHGVFVESPKLFTQKIVEACEAVTAAPPESRTVFPWRRS
jgi:pimeloyl-ACP methyl ester carboxylesterase